jgi:hypothetical protein
MNNKTKAIVFFAGWLVIVLSLAVCFKYIVRPKAEQAKQQAVQKQKQDVLDKTSGSNLYDNQIDFAIDSFCGFAGLRSQQFQEEMSKKWIKVNLIDDGADYPKRIKAFQDGTVQMGVFTLDALIKSTADSGGNPPATVVAFVDETRGADAICAYKDVFPNIDSLNARDVKFIRPEGPSDTLTRVLMSHFHLNNVSQTSFVPANDAGDVYDKYKKAQPNARQVYVLWEPYVSKMLENPNIHVVVDSSRFRGYILDVIVANRDFLAKNPEQVQAVVESYLRAMYANRADMATLLVDDGRKTNQPLSQKDAQRIVDGIWFKNTSDNYAQMGIEQGTSVQNVSDMIGNITHVLASTGAIASDPVSGKYNLFYFDGILRSLHDASFHPGIEKTRDENVVLPALTEEQWKQIVPVGRLNVDPLEFRRGTAELSGSSQVKLDELIDKLKTWPQYYVKIEGHASNVGDTQANHDLAQARAQAAQDYLTTHGIDANRVNSSAKVTGESSVNFLLGQLPY